MKSPLNRGGLRFYLVLLALVLGTWYGNTTTPRTILAGLPLLLVGVGLHTWAKGCLRQNQVVATTGPYRLLRHPFYLANALIDAGLVVMSGSVVLGVILPLWWLAIYVPVIRGEERHLLEKFPDVYRDYRRKVPCLIPWRRPLASAGAGFRWENPNIAGGEELPRAVRILAYPLLFFAAQGVRNAGLDWFRDDSHLAGLTGLLCLYVFAWEVDRHQRRRRSILPRALAHPLFRAMAATLLVAAVAYYAWPRGGYSDIASNGGIVLLLLSVFAFQPQPLRAIFAEMLALLGMLGVGGPAWLAPPCALIYMAWILDRALAGRVAAGEAAAASAEMPYWPYLYPLTAIACATIIGIKLAG